MYTKHYEQVKSVCDWLQSIDRNGSYTEVYEQWFEMDNQQKIDELEVLIYALDVFLENESDIAWIFSFEVVWNALTDVRNELMGGVL